MATNDNIQHGIDDNPNNDAEKGAALGGLGGVAVGAAAGSLAGPIGTIVGAVAGGLLGAGASGAAVAAVDAIDNDNTVSGVGSGATANTSGYSNIHASSNAPVTGADVGGHNIVTGDAAQSEAGNTGLAGGAVAGGLIGAAVGGPVGAVVGGTLGSLAGGVAGDATEAADDADSVNRGSASYAATTAPNLGTNTPDVHAGVGTPATHVSGAMNQNNAGQGYAADNNFAGDAFRASAGMGSVPDTNVVDTRDMYHGTTSIGAVDQNADTAVVGGLGSNSTPGVRSDTNLPGVQTGGVTTAGSDTRGIIEKTQDALTGDRVDDKTSGVVLNEPTTNAADSVRDAAHNAGSAVSGAAASAGNALHNAGSSVAGAVSGVIGDVTHAGNDIPGVQTGGTTTAGQDTRGITEKVADAVTGDNRDDKTGGIVR